MRRLIQNLTQFHLDCHKLFDGVKLFPIEMDLARSAFQTQSSIAGEYHDHDDNEEEEEVEHAAEAADDDKILNLNDEPEQSNENLISGLNKSSQENGLLLEF